MASVVFDPARFVQRYPVFAPYNTANPDGLQMFFDDATLYLNNTDCSPITDLTRREALLWMVTAHLAQLGGVLAPGGVGSTGTQVGRVADGTEGSVHVRFDMGSTTGVAAFWNQTQFGAQYWAATKRYRSFRYVPPIAGRGCGC